MSDSADELTPEQELAALALAQGLGIGKAAEAGGTSERSIFRWKRQPAFRARVRELLSSMVADAAGLSATLLAWSVKRLEQLAKSRNGAIALGATRALADLGHRLHEQGALADEQAELRAMVEELIRERQDHAGAGGAAAANGDGAEAANGDARPGRAAG